VVARKDGFDVDREDEKMIPGQTTREVVARRWSGGNITVGWAVVRQEEKEKGSPDGHDYRS